METRRLMRNVLTNLLEAVKLKLDIKKANVMSENELLNVFDLADSKKDGILDFEEVNCSFYKILDQKLCSCSESVIYKKRN